MNDIIWQNRAGIAANRWLWLKICVPQGLSEVPRGRPLVRFRLTETDNAELTTLLRTYLRPAGTVPRRLTALFCLFAADTLRRRPAGGAWAWQDITEPLWIADFPRTQLQRFVSEGMTFWQRPIRRSAGGDTLYLGSLVLEAGVPTALLTRSEFADFGVG